MLSLFPNLLTYELFVPFFFRLIVAGTFIWFGYKKIYGDKKEEAAFFENFGLRPGLVYLWATTIIEITAGILLLIGLFTQAAALVLSIISLVALGVKKNGAGKLKNDVGLRVLLIVITSSLLFLGPGIFAVDLPL